MLSVQIGICCAVHANQVGFSVHKKVGRDRFPAFQADAFGRALGEPTGRFAPSSCLILSG
ncbi:hypothetical protein NCCP2331_29900 [Sporosarcina sp. NCCP-2331]|nr:hypothetical protein NCCP2331_29900 [Sporosarcina sp. NCCP-2331]GLB57246.1 hypothetical protein NCCP2378_30340 [Sporosarcina sp. NCCP-2378]